VTRAQFFRLLRKRSTLLALAPFVLLPAATMLLAPVAGPVWLPVAVAVNILLLALLVIVSTHAAGRSAALRARNEFSQVESLLSLHATLRPGAPLPALRGWKASPDFLHLAVDEILTRRPALVVELGSGASTVFLGLALRACGTGRLLSLDHDAAHLDATRRHVVRHGLDDVVTLIHAPLTACDVRGRHSAWYDPTALRGVAGIGLLVVDGPPAVDRPDARYPAYPLLRDALLADAVVLLDDGKRAGERRIVAEWTAEDPALHAAYHPLEKGAFLLHRSA
jgi:hypothetical protein